MSKIKKLRSKIVHAKIFIQRSMSYVAILNSGMILFLVLSRLEVYKIDIELGKWFIPIFVFTFLIMILFGFLEDRFGFYSEESLAQTRRNPTLTNIEKRLDNIEKKLEKIK